MDVRVLGPVEVAVDGEPVAIGGSRPRTLLAVLAVSEARVSATRIIEELWGESAPASATGTVQSYVSRLRRLLGKDRFVTDRGGYQLVVESDEVDVERFRGLLQQARTLRDQGRLDEAISAYDTALGQWRGDVAEDVEAGPLIAQAAVRLDEDRLLLLEERCEAHLSCGRHHELIPDLESLVRRHPHRERIHAQRMVALYRAGRQGDALQAYREARDQFVGLLGVEPGPMLRELHQRILDQDPRLGLQSVGPLPDAVVVSSAATAGTQTSPATGLPTVSNVFVGRVAARRDLMARLASDARVVTLVGVGGCGKTQLALRVATDAVASFPEGVWWVDLADDDAPDRIVRSIADALGLPEDSSAEAFERVAHRLSVGRQLLVVDNCEHVIDSVADVVSELMRRSPKLRVLATSREPLDLDGEQIWRVPSLSVPSVEASVEEILESEAVQLLRLRGQQVRPDLVIDEQTAHLVAGICRDLDGIPLAIELAAARLNVLSLAELADRLEDRFSLLTQGRRTAPSRHRTLEAAVAWSYDLLDDDEQATLQGLSVFHSGATVPDAEAVCLLRGGLQRRPVDLLGALIDKSLVHQVDGTDGRVRLQLLMTVREFVEARTEPAERRIFEDHHAARFAEVAEEAGGQLTGADQVAWLNRLHVEQDNLRAVLQRDDTNAARIAASVWWFWEQFGHAIEGDRWLRRWTADGVDFAAPLRHAIVRGAARLANAVDDRPRARQNLVAAIALGRQLDERELVAADLAMHARLAAADGELDRADNDLAEARSLVTSATDGHVVAQIEVAAGTVARHHARLDEAVGAVERAAAGYLHVGDRWSACLAHTLLARLAREQGDERRAASLHRRNLTQGLALTVSTLDFVGLPDDLFALAELAMDAARVDIAAVALGAAGAVRTAVELPGSSMLRFDRLLAKGRSLAADSTFDDTVASLRVMAPTVAVERALAATAMLEA